jgi:hypothetical protein
MSMTPNEELRLLGEKRAALERAVRVAITIERMHHGLQAAACMGKSTASIPKKILASVDELDEAIKIMPSQKLFVSLRRLEKAITSRFALIMQLAELDEEQLIDEAAEDVHEIEATLKEYRKKAQTAIALKVLLHTRGEITKPLALSVSADDIRHRLSELGARQTACRLKVKKEIISLLSETDRILKRPDLPDEMREVVRASQNDCNLNLAHLAAGNGVLTMPVPIEIIQIDDRALPLIGQELLESAEIESPSIDESASSAAAPRKKGRPGFFYKLSRWMSTPSNVSWADVKRDVEAEYEQTER